ncbi:hypothetical protein [Synechocystis sp. PCC 7509]|uniref:hypothetical protein n=1 Tax=Synechocystis sp. PCC 7509 TaxID=927677 RepID=UPI0002ACADA1|nr:hypothetical protein [Synechocystis sp. PCC 7509]
MSLQETKEQAFKLSVSDRLTLVNLIIESLQNELNSSVNQTPLKQPFTSNPSSPIQDSCAEWEALIQQMRGFLKTDKLAPTDTEVQTMLEERMIERYLQ